MKYSIYGMPELTVNPLVRIDLEFSLGTMIDYVYWEPVAQAQINVDIMFDQQILYTGLIDQPIKLTKFFDDVSCKHLLEIKVSGFNDSLFKRINGKDHCVMVKMSNFGIEKVPADLLIQKHGQFYHTNGKVSTPSNYIGENGTIKFEFHSPVYQWLIDQGNDIVATVNYHLNNIQMI